MNQTATPVASGTLSKSERDRLCEDYFAWAGGWMHKKFGNDAVEFAGEGLFQAANTFNPSKKVPFIAWAIKNLEWVYRGHQRKELGGVRAHAVSLDAPIGGDDNFHFDPPSNEPSPETPLEHAEEWTVVAKRINELHGTPRWLIVARLFGGFSHEGLAKILDFNPQHLARVLVKLRQS
jgi:hypothetical protein